ncbi:MAG: ribbon-helix-helix protein, CopG family [Candidatus Neomarinimicrobiota bacterium]
MGTDVKRTTIYLDSRLHKALRLKAAETDRSISDLVNEALRLSLAEELEDLAAFDERAGEPNLRFEDVLKDLRRSGRI